jgi:hypothetical protein
MIASGAAFFSRGERAAAAARDPGALFGDDQP